MVAVKFYLPSYGMAVHASCFLPSAAPRLRKFPRCNTQPRVSMLTKYRNGRMLLEVRANSQSKATANDKLRTVTIPAQEATPDSFAAFGQVISATPDGKPFDKSDAVLKLDQGTPRFYIMRIPKRGLTCDRITYHDKVTQCLGGLGSESWYLVVAAPSGSVESAPSEEDLHAFKISQGHFVKLHQGAWHAGPLFDSADHMDFYNLELSDTNQSDHNTHVYSTKDGLQFMVAP